MSLKLYADLCTPVLLTIVNGTHKQTVDAQNYLMHKFSAYIPHFNIISDGLIMCFIRTDDLSRESLISYMQQTLNDYFTETI